MNKAKKHTGSPYAKMYMVGPAVYEKLLNCLDEVDRHATLKLNSSLNSTTNDSSFRPAEKYMSSLNQQDFDMTNDEQSSFLHDSSITKFPDPIPALSQEQEEKQQQQQQQQQVKNSPSETKNEKIKSTFNCDICPKIFKSVKTLQNHSKKFHNKIDPIISSTPSPLKFECELCEEKFVKLAELKRHVQMFHKKPVLATDKTEKHNTSNRRKKNKAIKFAKWV
jgi:hypothetical protein